MKWNHASFVATTAFRAKAGKVAIVAGAVLAAAWAWLPGCGSSSCGQPTCSDGFSAVIKIDQSALPSGDHTLTVEKDGTAISCTFAFPPPTLPGGGTAETQCAVGLSVMVVPDQTCTFEPSVTGGIQTCVDNPGKYNETISVVGTPTTVHVQQAVGGTILLDQSATPTYADYHPSCGPVCKEALVTWTMP